MSSKFSAIRSQPDLIPFPIDALLNMTFKQQRNLRFEGAAESGEKNEKQRHEACAEILSVTRLIKMQCQSFFLGSPGQVYGERLFRRPKKTVLGTDPRFLAAVSSKMD